MELLDKSKLLDFMQSRYDRLFDQCTRDVSGGLGGRNDELREIKYWKEAIQRGEFDFKEKDFLVQIPEKNGVEWGKFKKTCGLCTDCNKST